MCVCVCMSSYYLDGQSDRSCILKEFLFFTQNTTDDFIVQVHSSLISIERFLCLMRYISITKINQYF